MSTRPLNTSRLVTSIHDDSDVPLVGQIIGWEDEDRALVAWGDARYADNPAAQARIEPADELAPVYR